MIAVARIYAERARNGVRDNGHGAGITGVKEREQSRLLRHQKEREQIAATGFRSQLQVFR
jgi:hypothetical protein